MFNEIVGRLFNQLDVSAGTGCFWANDPARVAILAALAGKSKHVTAIVDVPHQLSRYIVLRAIDCSQDWLPDYPLLVKTCHHILGRSYSCCAKANAKLKQADLLGKEINLTTEEVASWFNGRSVNSGGHEFPATWAAAATESFAKATLAGDLGQRVTITQDPEWENNGYQWYDLDDVSVGGSIYRVSCHGTLWVFTRRDQDRWEVTVVPDADWPQTTSHRGSQSFGGLIQGALVAFHLLRQPKLACCRN